MRIAIDIRHLAKENPSGVGEYTLELLRALFELESGDDFMLFSAGTETARRTCLDNLEKIDLDKFRSHVRHLHLPIPNRKLNLQISLTHNPKLDTWLNEESGGCDVFFFPNINFISMERTPYVLTVHDMSWHLFPEFFTTKDQMAFKLNRPEQTINNARTIICPSTSTRTDLLSYSKQSEDKIQVVPHGIDQTIFNHKPTPQDHGIKSKYSLNRPYLLFLGTLEPRKNLSALLDAFEKIQKDHPELMLVMAGGSGWKSEEIKNRLAQNENVVYLEYVPHEHRPALYRQATAFIFPSIYEGFGLPVLEAMACGIPVITSNTSSLPEITKDAAILIDPFNSADLALSINQILDDPELAKTLKQLGIKQAMNFTWQKAAEDTVKALKKSSQ